MGSTCHLKLKSNCQPQFCEAMLETLTQDDTGSLLIVTSSETISISSKFLQILSPLYRDIIRDVGRDISEQQVTMIIPETAALTVRSLLALLVTGQVASTETQEDRLSYQDITTLARSFNIQVKENNLSKPGKLKLRNVEELLSPRIASEWRMDREQEREKLERASRERERDDRRRERDDRRREREEKRRREREREEDMANRLREKEEAKKAELKKEKKLKREKKERIQKEEEEAKKRKSEMEKASSEKEKSPKKRKRWSYYLSKSKKTKEEGELSSEEEEESEWKLREKALKSMKKGAGDSNKDSEDDLVIIIDKNLI